MPRGPLLHAGSNLLDIFLISTSFDEIFDTNPYYYKGILFDRKNIISIIDKLIIHDAIKDNTHTDYTNSNIKQMLKDIITNLNVKNYQMFVEY